jgi:hypothetical protein
MNTGIKIDRLEIHLKNISPEVARGSIPGLGEELMGQLSLRKDKLRKNTEANIDNIDSGEQRTGNETGSFDLRKMIAGRIAESIVTKLE